MSPQQIFNVGIIICVSIIILAIITAILLNISKKRLDKTLDAEYGRRRR